MVIQRWLKSQRKNLEHKLNEDEGGVHKQFFKQEREQRLHLVKIDLQKNSNRFNDAGNEVGKIVWPHNHPL